MLILPDHPLFDLTLNSAWSFLNTIQHNKYYVKGIDGLLRPASPEELTDYLEGGEYDEVDSIESEFEYEWMA